MYALMAFLPTRETLRSLLGWAPAPRSVLRMVDALQRRHKRDPPRGGIVVHGGVRITESDAARY